MSIALDIADAVADALAGAPEGTFSMEFTPEALAVPSFELSTMTTLHVSVVPASISVDLVTRATDAWDMQIDVGIQKRVNQRDVEPDMRPLATFTEEIADYLRARRLDGVPTALWHGMAIDPFYAVSHISEHATFTSVVRLFYLVHR